VQRYAHRVENYRLPKADTQRTALAEQIGANGLHLLRALEQPDAPAGLRELSSVQVLRTVWQQDYDLSDKRATWRGGPQALHS
jgi:transposase